MSEQAYMQGVSDFLDDLASKNPTPGGGAAAAVLGGIGCALTSMVGNLTVGKKKYAEVSDEAADIVKRADELRGVLVNSYKADVEAFDKVSAAFQMPKADDEQKKARTEAIQESLKGATLVPMECAKAGLNALDLAYQIGKIGNANAVSDAGVSAMALHSCILAATLNMRINLSSIKDEEFVSKYRGVVKEIESKANEVVAAARKTVLDSIG